MIYLVFLLLVEVLASKENVNELLNELIKSENFEILADKIAEKTIEKIKKLNKETFNIKNYEKAEFRTREDESDEFDEIKSTPHNDLNDITDEVSKKDDETRSDPSNSVSRPKVVLQFKEFVRSNEKYNEDGKLGSAANETKPDNLDKNTQNFVKGSRLQNKTGANKENKKKENLKRDKFDAQEPQKQEKQERTKIPDGRRAITRYIYVDSNEFKKVKEQADSETDFLSDSKRNEDSSIESDS